MFKPSELILCYSLLVPQKFIIEIPPNPNRPSPIYSYIVEPRPWYENKELITNDNIFDINDLQKLDIDESVDELK